MKHTWPSLAWELAEENDEHDVAGMLEGIRIAEELLGRAERALKAGRIYAAADYMTCAAQELTGEA